MSKIYIFLVALCMISASCKKFVTLERSKTELADESAFSSDGTAESIMAGIYVRLQLLNSFAGGYSTSATSLCGILSDEMDSYFTNPTIQEFANNNIQPENSNVMSIWAELYELIYTANTIVEGIEKPNGISAEVQQKLKGEAKFIRAFCYFYLVNFFGDVPLVLTTDYQYNMSLPRSVVADVYQQIVADLTEAQGLLKDDYSGSAGERTKPNHWVATALLARVYLYTGKWQEAETQATAIIEHTALFNLPDSLNSVFLRNSEEAIWQIISPAGYTWEANLLILTDVPGIYAMSDQLYNAFEPGDLRRSKWIGTFDTYHFAYKYKNQSDRNDLSEYYMVFRLAEQYLIRAEARIRNEHIEDGIRDLNQLRSRARDAAPGSLPPLALTLDKSMALLKVEQERRTELFIEWGHRWFDLVRTERANTVLGAIKDGWNETDQLMPIPQNELRNSPYLKQNPGYN